MNDKISINLPLFSFIDKGKSKIVEKGVNPNILTIFCWNINNPSYERACKQVSWLCAQEADIFILTECKQSKGCFLLKEYFQRYGYYVVFPKPEGNEYGVMIISKYPFEHSNFTNHINYLSSRLVSINLSFANKLEIIGTYVPSRDSSYEKIERKNRFLKNLTDAFNENHSFHRRIFCGDFNILEPDHIPYYSFFKEWEYDFYRNLTKYQLKDAFRHLNPGIQEYSWVGRTGDGYRYDHCFVSIDILPLLQKCYYLHEPREQKLSDHSALITTLKCNSKDH